MDRTIRELERLLGSDPNNFAVLWRLYACYERIDWSYKGRSVKEWGLRLNHRTWSARNKALRELASLGPQALPVADLVIERLWDRTATTRASAKTTLLAMGRSALRPLLKRLDSPKQEEQVNVLHVLNALVGESEERRGRWLCQAIQSGPLDCIRAGALLLGRFQIHREVLIEFIQAALKRRDWFLSKRICEGLGRLAPQWKVFPQALKGAARESLEDPSMVVRVALVNSLGHYPCLREDLAEVLQQQLSQESAPLRLASLESLRRWGVLNGQARAILFQCVHNEDPQIRERTAQLIGDFEFDDALCINHLISLSNENSGRVRAAAHHSLSKIRRRRTVLVTD